MIHFINVPVTLDAAAGEDSPRTITGVAVPWDTPAVVSSGEKISFRKGAFDVNAKAPKLLEGHDMSQLRGVVTELVEAEEGLLFTAKFAKTRASDEAIELVKAGAYDSVSIGAMPVKYKFDKNGTMVVSKANLIEISLVAQPAFADAVITEIAASQPDEESEEEVVEPQPLDIPEEEPMSDVTPTVEASAETVPTALFYSTPRSPIKTNADYLHHHINAKLNPQSESALWVAAADDAKAKFMITAADNSFSTNPAFNPVQYMSNTVQVNIGSRPVIDACGGTRAIPASGMTISVPKITTNGTVATTAEGGAPSETGIVSSYVNGTVVKLAGLQRWSVELQERSDPSFAQIMLDNMTRSYRKATEQATIAAIVAGGTQATATAATAAGIQSFVSTESAAAYLATGDVVSAYAAGVGQWSLMQNAVDDNSRPLFSAGQPQNSSGSAEATTLFGNVLGVPLSVSSNMASTVIDESAFLIVPSAIELFESSQLMLSTNVPASGEIEAMIYGYFCPIVTIAGGLRRFNLT
jgi:HK97 family phage prohead protease